MDISEKWGKNGQIDDREMKKVLPPTQRPKIFSSIKGWTRSFSQERLYIITYRDAKKINGKFPASSFGGQKFAKEDNIKKAP